MSEKFIVSNWFVTRSALNIQTFDLEGVEFELMALSESLIEGVELCETYQDMVELAADYGLSYNRKRVVDDADLAQDIGLLWGLDNLDIDADPCIRSRVGEKVCEISGITSVLEDMLEAEKARDKAEAEKTFNLGDGDEGEHQVLGSETMGDLSQDSLDADAVKYANA